MFLTLLLTIICSSCGVLSVNIISPCKKTDLVCLENSVNDAILQLFAGNPELGIPSSDPLRIADFVNPFSTDFNYKFKNSTSTGGKNTKISNIKFNEDFTNIQYDLTFTNVSLFGNYEINGKIFDMAVEGSGDYIMTNEKYVLSVDCKLVEITQEDGKNHIFIKSFKVTKYDPVKHITFEFTNLFNGQKEMGEQAHKLFNDNWLKTAETLKEPSWRSVMEGIFKNLNQYLKYIPVKDFQ